jgi:formamidopyrimidine-DNA glycosylase
VPELPETESIARALDRLVRGATITRVSVTRPDVLREASPTAFRRALLGRSITGVWRRAKLVVLDLDSGWRVVVQPRFTGALLIDDGTLAEGERRYSAVALSLADGRRLHYRDIRRLGTVTAMPPHRFEEYASALGPEPLDPSFTAAVLHQLLQRSGQAVKKVLMDQRRIAGIGNIYANEALWRAAIAPGRPARSLSTMETGALRDAVVSVLEESIALGGTTFRDYVGPQGERGGFVSQLSAYGRAGLPCPRCGRMLEEDRMIDGRSTVACAGCQR